MYISPCPGLVGAYPDGILAEAEDELEARKVTFPIKDPPTYGI